MKLKSIALFTLLVASVCAFARIESRKVSPAAARLESLKQLAGDWVALKDGKPTTEVLSSIRVTAAGTVVQETLFPGSEHEMITMYHLDGDDLILTHYCAAGNQPRMKAEPGEAGKIAFKFAGGTNVKGKDSIVMDHATITVVSKDRYQAEWVACQAGKECHKANFDVVRKK